MVTALELMGSGRHVTIVDRDEPGAMGGLAKWSFGGMFFVDTPEQRRQGMRDNVQTALNDWLSVAEFDPQDTLPRQWAERYVHLSTPEIYRWVKGLGIRFFPIVHWVERGLYRPGNSYPRFHMVWGTGHHLSETVRTHLVNHPSAASHLKLNFRHRVTDLVVEDGRVCGACGTDEASGAPFEIRADVTVVATGGMGGNLDKVRQHWNRELGTPPDLILNGSHRFALGDLHDAVSTIGGNVTHLDRNWHYAAGVHHPRPRHPHHGLSLVPPKSALWLDWKGERFGPMPLVTAYDTKHCVEVVARTQKKYSWQVLNMRIMVKEFAISGAESNAAIRDRNLPGFLKAILFGNRELVNDMIANSPDFVVADTLEELVKKMNALQGTDDVSLEAVRKAVTDYDDNIRRGPAYHNDEQLRRIAHARQYRGDKVRTCNFQPIMDPKAGPLVAIREFILSRKTMGGIQTDLRSRVLTVPGASGQSVIPGLYAVGEAAGFGGGGVHGKGALEGTFLGGCVLTGRVAAADILGKSLGQGIAG
jgi:hypothetical protein